MVQKMMQFDQNGEKCENFYRRVASVLSRAVTYKVMDDSGSGLIEGGQVPFLLAERARKKMGRAPTLVLCSRNARSEKEHERAD